MAEIDVVEAILESGRSRVVALYNPQALLMIIKGARDLVVELSIEDARQLRDALSEALEAMGVE